MCLKPLRCDTVRKMEEELEDSFVFDEGLDMEEDYYDDENVSWQLQDQVVELFDTDR